MVKLGSFVFFDLETTGLETPKITELSFIACSKADLLQAKRGEIPRVLHKQTFCLNPQKQINSEAEELTGLCNELLINESKFDNNTAQLIILFLERLQSPTCLVAHFGNRFDFVILKKELKALNARLPAETYCIDSWLLFKTLAMEPALNRFRLRDIYEHTFGEPPKSSHYAEADVKALLKCAIARGPEFVAYAEKHCVKFSDFSGRM